MPFYSPFNFPFFNNYRYLYSNSNSNLPQRDKPLKKSDSAYNKKTNSSEYKEKVSEDPETSEAFFEIFGLKLYFDDILIMCILFFLYTEKIKNEELFICLILLLLT